MIRTVEYLDLLKLFPGLSAGMPTSMHCLFPVAGMGRHIKRTARHPPHFADVRIEAHPSSTLSIRLAHSWPVEVSQRDVGLLDDAILLGIAEGIMNEEWPPMGCRISTVEVGFVAEETTPSAVRIAAAVAVRDVCRKPGWARPEGDEPPVRTA